MIMETVIVMVATTLLGGVGWWLGELVGIFTAFALSVVGTAAGVYVGRWFVRNYLP
jgi:hypothetical protein